MLVPGRTFGKGNGPRRQAFCAERRLGVAALDKYRQHGAEAARKEGRPVAVELIPGARWQQQQGSMG